MIEQDAKILTNIQKTLTADPNATQRTLAQNSNISLGMMNAVLKRCAERGWIAVKNLNMKKVCYCLTPEGLEEISRRSSGYMKRSFEMMNEYAEKIAEVIQNAKATGRTKVVLAGQSNIRFVIEYTCEKFGLIFAEVEDCAKINNNELVLCGELLDEKNCRQLCEQGAVSVMEI